MLGANQLLIHRISPYRAHPASSETPAARAGKIDTHVFLNMYIFKQRTSFRALFGWRNFDTGAWERMQSAALTPSEQLKRAPLPRQRKSKLSSIPPASKRAHAALKRLGELRGTSLRAPDLGLSERPPTAEGGGMCRSLPCRILAYNSNWRRVILIS